MGIMKHRFDFSVGYEGGRFSSSALLDEHDRPNIGDVIVLDIKGKARKVVITEILDPVVYQGVPRAPVYGQTADDLQ
nr:hypothetical protein [uncultured bacterium]